jgi:hypothetical protein
MGIRGTVGVLLERRIDTKAAVVVAGLHLAVIGYVVGCILLGHEEDWPMYWLLFLPIDAPIAGVWIGTLLASWWAHTRREPITTAATRPQRSWIRRLPVHLWMGLVVTMLSCLMIIASMLGAPLGHARDVPNFQEPLMLFGGLGTFLWSDTAGRIIQLVLTLADRATRPKSPVAHAPTN